MNASGLRMVGAAVLAVTAIALVGCAAGPNTVAQADTAQVAGFWLGLWQGLISPIAFLVSLFTNEVNIYEVNNNGNWYNFGFILGVSIAFSGSAHGGNSARRRRPSRPRAQT